MLFTNYKKTTNSDIWFALVDCNNFYASCERIFTPNLEHKPIVVLSNNDGCIIARSQESKLIGIKMGTPLYKAKEIIENFNVHVFSSNYTLYGDISQRIMNSLFKFSSHVEVYSIDEAFLDISKEQKNLLKYGIEIRTKIKQWVGIPVSVGIGKTKTLAKLANEFVKKGISSNGVYVIHNLDNEKVPLEKIELEDIWGIGKRVGRKIRSMNIKTILELMSLNQEEISRKFNVSIQRTIFELHGIQCINIENVPKKKKSICVSRSFRKQISCVNKIGEALTNYITNAAEKLRKNHLLATSMIIFIHTNPFRKSVPQHHESLIYHFSNPSNDTRLFIRISFLILNKMFKDNILYHKAGVILQDLIPEDEYQQNLFPKEDKEKSRKLMTTIDQLNHRMGRGTVIYASEGIKEKWAGKSFNKSSAYTTQWDEIPIVKAY
tara:strand:- start:9024 stop:10328 length:1305 start_codon:yes stop_codon:yes gene_type:complete